MYFCAECGMRIVKFIEKNGKIFGICGNGHETAIETQESTIKTSIEKEGVRESQIIINEGKKFTEQAITSITCPHCGGRRSRVIRTFMLFGDEDQINIMECLECGKNFRVGTGVSGH